MKPKIRKRIAIFLLIILLYPASAVFCQEKELPTPPEPPPPTKPPGEVSKPRSYTGDTSRSIRPNQPFSPKPGVVKPKAITMNFTDADIRVLIQFMSKLTGKNFLIDPRVQGRVTILSPENVTIDEAYQVFLSVLEVNGFTTVTSGKVIKIIPSAEARSSGVEIVRGKKRLAGDKFITQLLPLEYASAGDMTRLLKPLISKSGLLLASDDTNTLIIIDTRSNISRLLRIINELDVPGKEKITVFPLDNASATELSPNLINLFQGAKGKRPGAQQLKIIPDKRTNSLIVLADVPTTEAILDLLTTLDSKQARPRENIHIYRLQNAVAEDLAKILSDIPDKGSSKKKGAKSVVVSGDVKITADKATNSLVIIAEPEEYQILESVIKKLDVERAMVYVEALIMEVYTTSALDLGVEWEIGASYKGFGFSAGNKSSTSFNNFAGYNEPPVGTLPSGFSTGVLGDWVSYKGLKFPSIKALIRSSQADSDFNIISTPQILTLSNEEAVIEVGRNIPYVTSIDNTATDSTERVQTYDYRDVGLTLKVTPQINDNGYVRLQIDQSIKNIIEKTAALSETTSILAPTTTFRNAKTVISVKNGQTAVIAGLIDKTFSTGKEGFPGLRKIPLIGWLFGTKSDSNQKTNLMIFLTPRIIRNFKDSKKLSDKKKEEMDSKYKLMKKKKKKEDVSDEDDEFDDLELDDEVDDDLEKPELPSKEDTGTIEKENVDEEDDLDTEEFDDELEDELLDDNPF